MAILKVENLYKVYEDGTQALKDVSFEVEEGEFLVVIGLSGSGKSTLLRCINRLVTPTSGHIWFNGVDITRIHGKRLRETRREIAMIFQQFNLVKRSKVITNVISGRLGYMNPLWSLTGYVPPKVREDAMQALRQVGMPEKYNNRADALSGGQQQRVGIARALMQNPKLILADEPVASLDPVLAHSILDYLEKLNKERGLTVICSLHYLDLVQRYATRVIGLRQGEVVYRGSREDIQRITDKEFRQIYGEEAQRLGGGGILGEVSTIEGATTHE
ncbi:MAG: phosphonate ABC transporter ATP-binding protein [Phototrophicales bacterium]|nr:MAG: phosphonate ABC transporter ATP-binding protein [Phototrophicales bacterium]